MRKGSILLLVTVLLIGCTTTEPLVPQVTYSSISTGSTGPGDVLIEITPRGTVQNQLVFDFTANTHSVDLSQFDLREITTLAIGIRELHPVSAPQLSGHHVSGELVFDIEDDPETFILTIVGIPDVQVREFDWR